MNISVKPFLFNEKNGTSGGASSYSPTLNAQSDGVLLLNKLNFRSFIVCGFLIRE